MKGIQVKEYVQGPQDLKVTDLPDPSPKPNQYLIAVHAAATNFFDLLQIRGKYQHQPPLPWVSGAEFSGVILKAPQSLPGGKKPTFKEGDKVFGASQGAYATKVCATEEQLRPMPKGWSYFESAGLMVTAPTSYAGLVTRAGIKKGDWVLVHAAAGGVGLAAVQIAKAFGATVVATAGTQHKLDVAKSFGADHLVDYRQKDWPDMVKKLTPKGRGVDIVYDPVGLIAQSMKCTAWNGRLLVIGFAAGDIEKMATNRILLKNVSVMGLHWGAYAINEPEMIEVVWKGLFDLMESGKFRGTCYTDKEFVGLETIPEALKALGARDTWEPMQSSNFAHLISMSRPDSTPPLSYLISFFNKKMASNDVQYGLNERERLELGHRMLLAEQQRRLESRRILEASTRAPVCPNYSVTTPISEKPYASYLPSSGSTDGTINPIKQLITPASTASVVPHTDDRTRRQSPSDRMTYSKPRGKAVTPAPAAGPAVAATPVAKPVKPKPDPARPFTELQLPKDVVRPLIPATFSRFLSLPLEIRHVIYALLVDNGVHGILLPSKDVKVYHQAAITRVNRQIRRESIGMVYTNNAFNATSRDLIKRGLMLSQNVGDDKLNLIKNWSWITAKRSLFIWFPNGRTAMINHNGPNKEVLTLALERRMQVCDYLRTLGHDPTGLGAEDVKAITEIVLRITPKIKAKKEGDAAR
ncbi:hypothetical protein D6C86_00073 [Aureobasidium pullulans]|uniref:Enoyl reductase (ER) domain-containing protein n=1 Tax=Aureobasidium pullulans TaxID=5580 RepID=A0A4S9U7B8_AURPU|nr:hypothetical protein D6C94_00611 [Aureobasidium pullulans]THZ34000.1 hypothetical protein D6C87_10628 [Aureobasidium pullulans]THZ68324.1 hypothetical protein D6C86_00073 [Aureobasidium pullulans]